MVRNFNNLQESILEKIESVDMNRVLEEGEKIRMVVTEHFTLGVDVPEELKQAEKILTEDLTAKKYL